MNRLLAFAFALVLAIPALGGVARAQVTSKVLSTCGSASYTAGSAQYPTMDTTGAACGKGSTGAAASQVQGPTAAATAALGNPVPIGCDFNTSLPTYTNGQRAQSQCDSRGSVNVSITQAGTGIANINGQSDGFSTANVGLLVGNTPRLFNGSTWDRAFTCPNAASVNVTAGATTQIVGLSASTVIRVCSVSVSMSAAGTATFLTGTGANCGTPTAIMTAMTLATGTPWAQSAPEGGSLFRSTAGGEICVTAATGNVTGLITYAQY